MPTPLTFCRRRGCHARVRGGGYCCACDLARRAERVVAGYERRRGSSSARGYASADWRRKRAEWLAAHPYCSDPFHRHHGQQVRGIHVDHRRAKRAGGADAAGNFQTLCASCHSSKTVRFDGGFGRARRSFV